MRSKPGSWPKQLAYPLVGMLLSVCMVAGLLTLQGWLSRRPPTASWIAAELHSQPFVYAYLLVGTLIMMSILGWIVGRKEDLLEELSVTDPLTGLANRRRLRAAFSDENARAARYGTPLALLLIDLDNLKTINDQHGHACGDRALQLVAESLRTSSRATDLAARYGGDEFIVLAVNTSATEALALAHRIGATVRRLGAASVKRGKGREPIKHTVSIGVADLELAAAPTFESLHAAADHALYAAKAAGRDCAVAAAPEESGSHPQAQPITEPSNPLLR
jgi:diguanylate cyclase (GGDEF)-like protein